MRKSRDRTQYPGSGRESRRCREDASRCQGPTTRGQYGRNECAQHRLRLREGTREREAGTDAGHRKNVREAMSDSLYRYTVWAMRDQITALEKERDSLQDAGDIMMRRHDDELHAAHANGRAEIEKERDELRRQVVELKAYIVKIEDEIDPTHAALTAERDELRERLRKADSLLRLVCDETEEGAIEGSVDHDNAGESE